MPRTRISSRSQRRLARGCCRAVCVELYVCLTFHGISDVAGGTQGPVSTLLGHLGQKHTAQLIGGVVTLEDTMRLNREQTETFADKKAQIEMRFILVSTLTGVSCNVRRRKNRSESVIVLKL